MEKYILIKRINNLFFEVTNDDAIIINYFFNYKILDFCKLRFNTGCINKIINVFENNHISYKVIDYNNTFEKYYKKINNYDKILNKAYAKKDFSDKINVIINKLNSMNEFKLNKALSFVESLENEN